MKISWLGLTSLKSIRNGDVGLAWNYNLCYIEDLRLRSLFDKPQQRSIKRDNKPNTDCGKYVATMGAGHNFNAFLSDFNFFCVGLMYGPCIAAKKNHKKNLCLHHNSSPQNKHFNFSY